MAIDKRMKIYEAISGSTIHQSISTAASQASLSRCQASQIRDPTSALENLRSLIQPEINIRIQKVLADIAESHLKPAIRNLRLNLGDENVPGAALEDVCISALENAKEVYQQSLEPKHQRLNNNNINNNRGGNYANQVLKRSFSNNSCHLSSPVTKKSMVIKSGLGRPNTDLVLVNKAGRPVRREGPKWESERLTSDTLFILGSRANKALGFGQTRGRLYIKHPELFKYSGDQTDKEWLAKANLMATTGGKAYLMVLQDILDLAESPEYSSHPKQQPGELVGFTVPDWMLEKMKAYIETAKTNPETTDDELLRMAEEYAEMEEEGRKMRREDITIVTSAAIDEELMVMRKRFVDSSSHTIKKEDEMSLEGLMCGSSVDHDVTGNNVAHLFNDIKHESVDDDLDNLDPGFLQGMNLHNLVREFEMDTGSGSELNLLALADDSIQ
jgi:deoxynucleotidyltransferase terminal-interacting protein 1